jgi:hypothetical protein
MSRPRALAPMTRSISLRMARGSCGSSSRGSVGLGGAVRVGAVRGGAPSVRRARSSPSGALAPPGTSSPGGPLGRGGGGEDLRGALRPCPPEPCRPPPPLPAGERRGGRWPRGSRPRSRAPGPSAGPSSGRRSSGTGGLPRWSGLVVRGRSEPTSATARGGPARGPPDMARGRPCGRPRPGGFPRRPTLPPGCPGSTIGAGGLNFRVRNVSGCVPSAGATGDLWLRSVFGCVPWVVGTS